jgi:DNA-binding LacI/PurR family transcriptional regulator
MNTGNHGAKPRRNAVTSKDVAALAGVSQSTVSFVINGKQAVSDETRRRVQEAMRKLSYQPNAGARTLRTSKSNIISLFVEMSESIDANESTPYIDAFVRLAHDREYDIILNTTHGGIQAITRLAGKSICDAFILMDIRTEDERIRVASELNMPVVLVGRPKNPMGLDLVDFDARKAAQLAVDELADTGHRHIAMVGASLGSELHEFQFVDEFYAGARDQAAQRGIDLTMVARMTPGWNGMNRCTEQLLAHRDDRLGIIVRQPQPTEWLLRALQLRGITPGKDVSVVSHCSDLSAVSFAYPVTNISTLPARLAQQATSILFGRLNGSDEPPHYDLIEPTGITRRATTIDFTK